MIARQTLETSVVLDDKYRIERVIGAGGFGITYEAEHVALQRKVAIKEFFPEEFAVRRGTGDIHPRSEADRALFEHMRLAFLKEARAVSRFEHPAITRVLGVFEAFGTVYIVMRFEDGPSLKAWLQGLGRRPTEAEIDRIVWPLLDALEFIHSLGYLHRDIAPDNILLKPDLSPVLIDFGAARPIMTAATSTITGIVKRGYSPPEQYSTDSRSQGPWTDIYALAGTLYQCVTGSPPLDATQRLLDEKFSGAAEIARGSYRSSLLEGIDRGLAIQPRERPQTIDEWRAILAPSSFEQASPVGIAAGDEAEAHRAGALGHGRSRAVLLSHEAPSNSVEPVRRRLSSASVLVVTIVAALAVAAAGLALRAPLGRLGQPDEPVPPSLEPGAPARPSEPNDIGKAPPAPLDEPASLPVEQATARPLAANLLVDLARGTFRDCATCPELVVIPAGEFLMGSPTTEVGHQASEAPQRSIAVPRSFALARSETTRGEWRSFSDATSRPIERDCRALQFEPERIADYEAGRAQAQWAATGESYWDNTNYPQDDTHPVACISFADAEAYLAWLSQRAGARYRLPSEAEWEYAARAGTTTPFSFGATVAPRDASYHQPSVYPGGEAGSWRRATMPVGSFPANRLGLHDLHGNVWEWVADCAGAQLSDLDGNGRPHISAPCEAAAMRGGAFWTRPEWIRSAHRYSYSKTLRGAAAGFRAARDLNETELGTLQPLLERARRVLNGQAER